MLTLNTGTIYASFGSRIVIPQRRSCSIKRSSISLVTDRYERLQHIASGMTARSNYLADGKELVHSKFYVDDVLVSFPKLIKLTTTQQALEMSNSDNARYPRTLLR